MKKKFLRWTIVPVIVSITFIGASSFTDAGESNSGSGGGKCEAPYDNICYKIIVNGTTITKKGVLHIRP